jgi:hypothetical protein
MDTPTPTKYHQPAWELTTNPDTPREHRYIVWGPGSITHDGHDTGKVRDHWAASWQGNYGGTGGFTEGASLDRVLGLFPPAIAAAFRKVAS